MFRTLKTCCSPSISTAVNQPLVLLDEPLTGSNCNAIRTALQLSSASQLRRNYDSSQTNAAILIPICNVNGKPGLLFEVRGKLRTHSGEVSFPGGKLDENDSTPLATALRETQEEVGIHPDQVEILGRLAPPEKSLSGMSVWPYVGFVYPKSRINTNDAMPLPSLSLSSLTLSRPEVAQVFHLPLAAAVSPRRIYPQLFRGARPYYAVSVAELVEGAGASQIGAKDVIGNQLMEDSKTKKVCSLEALNGLKIWGLTGWFMNVFLRTIGVYEQST